MKNELIFCVTREEATLVLEALSTQPYRMVFPIIKKLVDQAETQDKSPPEGNGDDDA